jgi:hypothetical protein
LETCAKRVLREAPLETDGASDCELLEFENIRFSLPPEIELHAKPKPP